MKLYELATQKGTYAGVRFSKHTVDAIQEYMHDNHIPHALAKSKFHTTLLYSRKYCPEYKPLKKAKYTGTPTEFVIWDTKSPSGGSSRALVLKYKCPELVKRHEELRKKHEATHDYPTFEPHITLSYDIGDMKLSEFPDIKKHLDKIEIVGEYTEDLDLDWAKSNSK